MACTSFPLEKLNCPTALIAVTPYSTSKRAYGDKNTGWTWENPYCGEEKLSNGKIEQGNSTKNSSGAIAAHVLKVSAPHLKSYASDNHEERSHTIKELGTISPSKLPSTFKRTFSGQLKGRIPISQIVNPSEKDFFVERSRALKELESRIVNPSEKDFFVERSCTVEKLDKISQSTSQSAFKRPFSGQFKGGVPISHIVNSSEKDFKVFSQHCWIYS